MRKLLVLFPGRGYTVDMPLFYYARLKYRRNGYEIFNITYPPRNDMSFDKWVDVLVKSAGEQLCFLDNSDTFDDIVFLSKSIGTVIALKTAENFGLANRHVLFTPISRTLNYIKSDHSIKLVIFGTADPYVDATGLKEQCEQNAIDYLMIEGADHRLETNGTEEKNIEILRKIIEAC